MQVLRAAQEGLRCATSARPPPLESLQSQSTQTSTKPYLWAREWVTFAVPAGMRATRIVGDAQRNGTFLIELFFYPSAPEMQIDPSRRYQATLRTSAGDMVAELYAEEAPLAVNNFVFLARDHFYEGVRFHRIIAGFMVQTGDPTGNGTGGPGYRFRDEPVTRKYERGTLAMANAGANTNGSQFFIVHADYPLPPQYTIFGKVIAGLDVLDRIAQTPVVSPTGFGEKSSPTQEIVMERVLITED